MLNYCLPKPTTATIKHLEIKLPIKNDVFNTKCILNNMIFCSTMIDNVDVILDKIFKNLMCGKKYVNIVGY